MGANRQLAGIGFGLIAYGIWGFFPLFFRQLGHLSPLDILSNRAVWACVFVGLLLTLRRRWHKVLAVFRQPRQLAMLALAALLVGSNWLMFLWAVANRQVVASSLGYFLTPLVSVLLGLVVLKERLNRLEWIAVALALAALANEIVTLGSLPWVSLFLAATFGCYGLVRKQVPVDALSGLWLETLAMLPLCGLYALWQAQHGHLVFALHDTFDRNPADRRRHHHRPAADGLCRRHAAPRPGHRRHADVHQPDAAVCDRHLAVRRAAAAGTTGQFRPDLDRAVRFQLEHVGKVPGSRIIRGHQALRSARWDCSKTP